jgi:hypothetical protein
MKCLTFIVLLIVAAQAAAATVYKCTVDGRITYQQLPCSEGGVKLEIRTGGGTPAIEIPPSNAFDPGDFGKAMFEQLSFSF